MFVSARCPRIAQNGRRHFLNWSACLTQSRRRSDVFVQDSFCQHVVPHPASCSARQSSQESRVMNDKFCALLCSCRYFSICNGTSWGAPSYSKRRQGTRGTKGTTRHHHTSLAQGRQSISTNYVKQGLRGDASAPLCLAGNISLRRAGTSRGRKILLHVLTQFHFPLRQSSK